jgi:hypothetical protein
VVLPIHITNSTSSTAQIEVNVDGKSRNAFRGYYHFSLARGRYAFLSPTLLNSPCFLVSQTVQTPVISSNLVDMSEEPAEDVKPKLNLTVNYEGQSEPNRLASICMFLALTRCLPT